MALTKVTKSSGKNEPKGFFIQKVIKSDTYMVLADSQLEQEDAFVGMYYTLQESSNAFLQPPYDPKFLLRAPLLNNVLNQCIDALEVNVDGTGYTLEPADQSKPIDPKEESLLKDFFDEPYPGRSLITIRRLLRRDLEAVGWGFLEFLRSATGDLVAIRNVLTPVTRMVKLDAPVQVTKTITRGGKEVPLTFWTRERRYAQKIGTSMTYFREYGATRQLNKETGEWESKAKAVPMDKRASDLMMFTVNPDPDSMYGVPHWINNLPSVLGSRKAEEQNLEFFDAGGVPPAIIFVQGGQLGKGMADQLRMYLSGQMKSKNRAVVVEATSTSGSLDGSGGSVQVKVERFGSEKMSDPLYKNYDEASQDHVRTAFRLPPLFLGKASDYNFACYSEDTETLTDHGWITHDQFVPGMKIATVNQDTLQIEYHAPFGNRALVYDVQNVSMYHIKRGSADLLVTPNHNMMYGTDKGPRRVTPIEKMMELGRVTFAPVPAGKAGGNQLQSFQIPMAMTGTYDKASLGGQTINGHDFLEFLGYWVSEGTSSDAYSQRGVVTVGQKKQPHVQTMQACFDRLSEQGLKTYQTVNPHTEMHYLSVKNFGLKDWLDSQCGHRAYGKRLPVMFRSLCQSEQQVLFDALMLGDGTWDSREGHNSGAYSTTSVDLASDVQELATCLGIRAVVRKDRPGSLGNRPCYRVLLTKDASYNQIDTSKHVSRTDYTGKVYCFSVPNHVFVTRRNGRVAMQGNTAKTAYMVAEAQVFQPEREEFDEIINKTILKEFGIKTCKFKSNPITLKDVDQQIKVVSMFKDIVQKDDLITEVNGIVGTSMIFDEVADQAAQDQKKAMSEATLAAAKSPNATVIPGAKGAPVVLPKQSAGGKGAKAGKAFKSEGATLVQLALDYGQAKGFLIAKYDMSDSEKEEIMDSIRALSDEDREAVMDTVSSLTMNAVDPELMDLFANHEH